MKKWNVLPLILSATAIYAEPEMAIADEPSPLMGPNYFEPQLPTQEEFRIEPSELFEKRRRKNDLFAAGLSYLLPGLGHVYLEEYGKATGLFSSVIVPRGMCRLDVGSSDFQRFSGYTGANMRRYSAYAAYRDARAQNLFEGYYYEMPRETLADLTFAPFQWSVMKKPEVWAGTLGLLAVGTGYSYLLNKKLKHSYSMSLSKGGEHYPATAFPIAIGEEAMYRGLIQSIFMEEFSPVKSIVLSSLVFGYSHITNIIGMDAESALAYSVYVLPYLSLSGAYLGWLAHRNRSLKECTAVHAWYDFALFFASYSVATSASIGRPTMAFSFSF